MRAQTQPRAVMSRHDPSTAATRKGVRGCEHWPDAVAGAPNAGHGGRGRCINPNHLPPPPRNPQIPDGKVEFRNLTLRNPPPGPPGYLPYTLLRLPIWTAAFKRKILGSDIDRLLTVTDCTVELPPEEVAMLMADAGLAAAALPPSLSGLLCAAGSDLLYNTRRYNTVRSWCSVWLLRRRVM